MFGKKKYELTEEERRYLLLEKRITSREYRIFREREARKRNWYELLAGSSGKILKVKPSKDKAKEIQSAINFTGLRVTPTGVYSSMFLMIIVFLIAGLAMLVLSGLGSFTLPLVLIVIGIGFGYYLSKYPENQVKIMRIRASSQVVLAILYMVFSI